MSTYMESFEKLPIPAITVCNKTAFKNHERNVNWNAYMENTLNLTDFLIIQNLSFQDIKIKQLSTMFYGRCSLISNKLPSARVQIQSIYQFSG